MENIILRTRAVNLRNRSDESSYELTTFQALKVKILQSSRKMAQKSKFTKNIWSILARLKQNFANKDGLINRPENEPSIDNFYKDKSVGSMWCWIVNAGMLYYAAYLLFYLPFFK